MSNGGKWLTFVFPLELCHFKSFRKQNKFFLFYIVNISILLRFKVKKFVCLSNIIRFFQNYFFARKCFLLVKDKTHSSSDNNKGLISTVK